MRRGALAAAITGAAVALITARLRADYLAIVTLGFSESVRIAAANEIWLTNGSDGIAGIPGPWRGELPPQQFNLMFLGIVVAVLAAVFVVLQRIGRSPFGRVLRAIRDDEDVAAVAGKHVLVFKVKAFAVGAAVLGIAGALYAHETSYVAPDIFAPLLTLNIILALVAGGVGNNAGAVLGAVLIVALLEGTRFAAPLMPFLEPAQVAAVRELLVSVLLLVIMRALPAGQSSGSGSPRRYACHCASRALQPARVLLAQARLQHLAGRGVGSSSTNTTSSGIHHLAILSGEERQQFLFGDLRALLAMDQQQGTFLPARMPCGDHRGLQDAGMADREVLDLDRADPLTAGLDHVLGAIGDGDEAVGIHVRHVAGAEPAVVIHHLAAGALEVAGQHPVAARLDLADRMPSRGNSWPSSSTTRTSTP